MSKQVPVGAAQYILELLMEQGHALRDVHRVSGVGVNTLYSVKLGRFPLTRRVTYESLVKMLGYEPEDTRYAEFIDVTPEAVLSFADSEVGRKLVDEFRDGVSAA